jgi:hypothetical protein
VSVYERLLSDRVPARIEGVQFGFGQTCGALNALADSAGTRNCPFLEEVSVGATAVREGRRMRLDQIAAVVGAIDGRRVVSGQIHVRVRVPDAPEHVRRRRK